MPSTKSKNSRGGGLSYRAYGQHRKALGLKGTTPSAVKKAVDSGRIRLNAEGKIDPVDADAMWAGNTDPTKGSPLEAAGERKPQSGERPAAGGAAGARDLVEDLDLVYERARLAKAQADKVELDNAERAGSLIDRDAAINVFTGQVAAVKNRLLGLGAGIAGEVCSALGVDVEQAYLVQGIIDRETREALEELSADAAESEIRKS